MTTTALGFPRRWKWVAALAFLGLAIAVPCWAMEMPRESLDAWWEDQMLAGRAASYHDGTEFLDVSPPRHGSFESADGIPDRAWWTTRGIRLQDLRETRLLGLSRRGGWRLEGGLLARAVEGRQAIELYGRSVWEVPPVVFHLGWSLPRAARHSYDFFLLRRIEGTPPAALMSKWTIPAGRVPPGGELRGLLEYDPATRAATVTIEAVGSRRVVLQDRVRVSP